MKSYRMKSVFEVILMSVLFISVINVQGQNGKRMTLHDCMEYAMSNSTKMRIQATERSDEQWQRRQAIMRAFTPSLDAQTYAYNQYGRNLDPETNTYNNVTTFYNGYNVGAGIILFDGFQAINNLKMSSTAIKMGLSKQQQIEDQICLATMEAYSNVMYYSKMEKVIIEQVSIAKAALNRATRQEELGQKRHSDVVLMESELAQKEYLLISATNEKENAIITLKDVMFWPMEVELELDTNIIEPICQTIDVANIETMAKSTLPTAQIASYNVESASLGLKRARGSYSPTLSLNGGWSTTYYTYPGKADFTPIPFNEQFKNNGGEYIQLSLRIPILDQLGRRTTLKMKKNALLRVEAEYDQTMRDIENEVARAINDRRGAEAAYKQASHLAEVQQEAFRLSSKQFEAGLISAIEYQSASQTYLNAMAERMNSLLKLKIKDAVVRYYNGESYINQ